MPEPPNLNLYRSKSKFLAAMGDEEFRNLHSQMQPRAYQLGTVLYRAGERTTHLYFPLDACISIIAGVQDGREVEVALVGSEGFAVSQQRSAQERYGIRRLSRLPASV